MNYRMIAAAIAVLTSFVNAPARADGEGNGDPFPFAASATVFAPGRYAVDTGSNTLPDPTGRPARTQDATDLASLPAAGSDAPIQTANSLPARALEGTPIYAQSQATARFFAARNAHPPMATASRPTPNHGG